MDDDEQLALAAELFRTLSNPSRLRVLRVLGRGALAVGELAEQTGLSQPMTSQHLRSLRTAGLVAATRSGRSVVYAIADEHVGHVLEDALTHVAEPTRPQHPSRRTDMSTTADTHAEHTLAEHTHGPDCGHDTVQHGDHLDYIHGTHHHAEHGDHYDEHESKAEHSVSEHTHGADCGHETVQHGDHVDYVHDGHKHAAHADHYDEH